MSKKSTKQIILRTSEVLAALMLAASIITLFLIFRASTKSRRILDDDISGQKYSLYTKYNTGKSYYFVGFNDILNNYFPNQRQAVFDLIANYVDAVKPELEKISYVKHSFRESDNRASFKIDADGDEFEVKLERTEQSDFDLKIYSGNSLQYSYKSNEHHYIEHNPQLLATKELPITLKTEDGKPFAIQSKDSKTLEIIINSCGEQSIKDSAIESTKQWLRSIDYSPSAFDYTAGEYCDKE